MVMAFHRGELDSDTAERMLGHRVAPDDAPPGYREVARLLQAANTEAQPQAVMDDAIVGAMVDAIVNPASRPARASRVTRLVGAKLLATGAVVAFTATGAAAATGNLPQDAQHGVAQAAQHIGLNLPDTANDHAREHTRNRGPKATTPATAHAPKPKQSDAGAGGGAGATNTTPPTGATGPSAGANPHDAPGAPASTPPTDNHGAVVSDTAHAADPSGGKGDEVAPAARDNPGAEQRSQHANPHAATPNSVPHPNDQGNHSGNGNGRP
jgi:hypothetical protein